MHESTDEQLPSQYLHDVVSEFFRERELLDATEVTFESLDGGAYWIRRVDDHVQSILCRLPIEEHFERRVQVHWSIAPDETGAMQLTESLYRAEFHPEDPQAGFTVQPPIVMSEDMVDDLVGNLLEDAKETHSDLPSGERVAYRALAIRAFMARLAATNADIGTVSTGVFVLAT